MTPDADADLTIVILRQVQSDISGLKADVGALKVDVGAIKDDLREVKGDLQIVSERLANLERRDVIREAQQNVERRNEKIRDERVDAALHDLQTRVTRLESEK